MIPLPKPRGFWDYALFAFIMTGLLLGLFWVEASDRIRWADAAVAGSAAMMLVLAIILGRRNETAAWIARPARWVRVAAMVGILIVTIGAVYADEYLLHRKDITVNRFHLHLVVFVVLLSTSLLRLRRRTGSRRQLS